MNIIQCLFSVVIPDVLIFAINVAGLLIIFFTLKEMIKARKESYRPKIYIKSKKIYLQSNDIDTNYIWKDNINDIYENCEYPIENNYTLELENVGLGAALNIIVKFEYEYNQILDIIRKYSNEYPDRIKITDNELEIISEYGSCKYPFFSSDELFVYHRRYLLPVEKNNNCSLITIPGSLILLLNTIVRFERLKDNNVELPQIVITIECEDISKKKYISTNHITFNCHYFSVGCLLIENSIEIKNVNVCVMEMHQE